jgi:hypothetical protein
MAERTDSVGAGAPAADVPASGVLERVARERVLPCRRHVDRGQGAVALAGRYGTPLLVFDRSDLVARLGSAKRAFRRRSTR